MLCVCCEYIYLLNERFVLPRFPDNETVIFVGILYAASD